MVVQQSHHLDQTLIELPSNGVDRLNPHFLQSLGGHCIGVPRGMYPLIYPQKPNIPVIASRDFLTFG